MGDSYPHRSQHIPGHSSLPPQEAHVPGGTPAPSSTTGNRYSVQAQDPRLLVAIPVGTAVPGATEAPIGLYQPPAGIYNTQSWPGEGTTMAPEVYNNNVDQPSNDVPATMAYLHDSTSYHATPYAPVATPAYSMAPPPVPTRPPTAYSSRAVRQRSRAGRMLSRARAHIDSVHESTSGAEASFVVEVMMHFTTRTGIQQLVQSMTVKVGDRMLTRGSRSQTRFGDSGRALASRYTRCSHPLQDLTRATIFPDSSAASSPTMSPIQNLPEDVLHDLFNWLSVIDQPTLFSPSVIDQPITLFSPPVIDQPPLFSRTIGNRPPLVKTSLGWITATHVCRRWRSSILSMPFLWAAIAGGVSASQPTCETFIERAGQAPLHFWEWHLRQFGRIESHTDYSGTPVRSTIARLTPRYSGRLERLALYISGRRQTGYNGVVPDDDELAIVDGCYFPQLKNFYLESDVLRVRFTAAFEAPKLESLHMDGIFLAFRAPVLRFLRISSRQLVSFGIMLDSIASSPLLEELELYNVSMDNASPFPHSHEIRLPRLAVLRYQGEHTPFRLLREAIDIPQTALLSLGLSGTTESELAIIAYARDFISQPMHDSLRLSFSDDDNPQTFHVHIYQSTAVSQHSAANGRRSRSGVHAYLRVQAIWSQAHKTQRLVAALLAATELVNIRYLDLDRIAGATFVIEEMAMFQRVLRTLTDVTSVFVGRESDLDFAHWLLCPNAPATPLFPHLRSLVLKHPRDTIPQLTSSSLKVLYGFNGPRQHIKMKWNAIINLCTDLRERGVPLTHIYMTTYSAAEIDCDDVQVALDVQERCLERVRGLVENVVIVEPVDQ
ncbi:unnamed protein product [Peniophora sp. CBMAI 1063]|nr:unnamed protein product [Peniophora sp. CBMAI 1063]